MSTHITKLALSTLVATSLCSTPCHGTTPENSTKQGEISLVKLDNVPYNNIQTPSFSLRNNFLPSINTKHFSFTQNGNNLILSNQYNPLSHLFHDFIHKKDELSFTILAMQSPIYEAIVSEKNTKEEGKFSLYDINDTFYILCEKPLESQFLVELRPDNSLKPTDFHYLFRLYAICEDEKHLYVYLSDDGTNIAFQREGDDAIYPMFHEENQEIWLFFSLETTTESEHEKTLSALKNDFQNQEGSTSQKEKTSDQTFSLENEDKSLSAFHDSYLQEHNLSVPRQTTEDFLQNQEERTLDARHSNTIEISEKNNRERSITAFVHDFQETTEPSFQKSETAPSYTFQTWETALSFYENILFQSLMEEVMEHGS